MEPQPDQTPIQPELIKPKNSKAWIWILLAIIITAIIIGGGVYVWQQNTKTQTWFETHCNIGPDNRCETIRIR